MLGNSFNGDSIESIMKRIDPQKTGKISYDKFKSVMVEDAEDD